MRMLGRILIALWLAVLLLVHCTLADIPQIRPEHFDRRAVELERTPEWRYGYVYQFHAAVLIKSRTAPLAPPFVAPRTDNTFAAILTPEIHRRRPKAWAELALYALLFAYARSVYPLRDARWPEPSLRRAVTGGLAAFGLVLVALGPYVASGYGAPVLDVPSRPGTLTRVGVATINQSVGPAITYTRLVQFVVILPLVSALSIANAPERWLDQPTAVWFLSAVFWTLAAVTVPALRDTLLGWQRRRWPRKNRPDARP